MLLLIGVGQPRRAPLHRPRRLRHPPRRHPAPHLRLRPPLLPRRQPRPARRPGRARRAAQPLPRVGRRLRRHRSSHRPRPCAAGSTCPSCSAQSTSQPTEAASETHGRRRLQRHPHRPSPRRGPPAVLPVEAPRRVRPVRRGDGDGQGDAAATMLEGSGYLDHPNLRTAGHHDPAARLADYDHDGIAAGVIFHGSMNMEPIPFISAGARQGRRPTATASSPASACRSTTAGSPTSCRRHRTATSASPTSRCGTSTPRSPRSSGRTTPGCAA